ncbi:MAG: glycosyltransferase family 2 protein [Caulobacteraceae bacterium]|nr:glycosyltransferase family 2 protein [Caulobacteraceae bacterium]
MIEASFPAVLEPPRFAEARAALRPCELTVVVPTFNEGRNVERLVEKLKACLGDTAWQAIFVDDDSPDGTSDIVKRLAAGDNRIQCLRRIRRRGLAGAVIEGAMASAAPYVAVIDGDLQHDETLLPAMLDALREGRADLVIGSRYLDGAGPVDGLPPLRRLGSQAASWFGRLALTAPVTDPVSGFFMIRRTAIEAVAPRLSPDGFKILFDIIASQPSPLRIVELPYGFRERADGASKMDGRVALDYLGLVLAKRTHDLISPRMLVFGLVGASGLVVHLAVLHGLFDAGLGFAWAQLAAALTAMTSNYLINNAITYRDRRKKGAALILGYLKFCALCSVGLAANVAVAAMLHEHVPVWWLAGASGAAVGSLWNYVSTSVAVW